MPGGTQLDAALARAHSELSVVAAAGGGMPDDGAERALDRVGLALTLVNIRLDSREPRVVMKARFELTHPSSGEARVVEVFVPSSSADLDEAKAAGLAQDARRQAEQELLGQTAIEATTRSSRPTVELPEI